MKNKNTEDKLQRYNSQMTAMKEKMLEIILTDETLTQFEKLRDIDDNDIFETGQSLVGVFDKYIAEYKKIITENIGDKSYYEPIIDDYFSDWERYQEVNFRELLETIDAEDGSEEVYTILTNRTYKDIVYKISKAEMMNHIFNFAIENKMIGFKINW